MANSLLQCKQLSWHINNSIIVDDVSLVLNKGETLGIVGPNGAGKTSLLKCLSGQYKASTGEVLLVGKNLSRMPRKDIAKRIAMVNQFETPVFNLTVSDIVEMGLIPHKGLFDRNNQQDSININKALTQVALQDKHTQLFNTLSGGEQQRCLIAQAIVQNADILIMDEPTNHLDIFYQHQILQLVKSLGLTLILTIHDLNLAAEYCDRIVIMDAGKCVADDTPEKVLTSEMLKRTFHLDCHIDHNPFSKAPRITFCGKPSPKDGVSHESTC